MICPTTYLHLQAPSRPHGATWESVGSSTAWCGSPDSSGTWALSWPRCWTAWSAWWPRRPSSIPSCPVGGEGSPGYTVALQCCATLFCHTVPLQCCAAKFCYTVPLHCSATLLRYTVALQCCATMLHYNVALQCCATKLRYNVALQYCATMLHCNVAL